MFISKYHKIVISALVSFIVLFAGLLAFDLQLFLELFSPNRVDYVDSQHMEHLIVERGISMNGITQAVLDGRVVEPCALHHFLSVDALLQAEFKSHLIDGSFLAQSLEK